MPPPSLLLFHPVSSTLTPSTKIRGGLVGGFLPLLRTSLVLRVLDHLSNRKTSSKKKEIQKDDVSSFVCLFVRQGELRTLRQASSKLERQEELEEASLVRLADHNNHRHPYRSMSVSRRVWRALIPARTPVPRSRRSTVDALARRHCRTPTPRN